MMGVVCPPGKQKEELCVMHVPEFIEADWPIQEAD